MQQRPDRLNAFRQYMDALEMMIQGASKVPFTNNYIIDRDKAVTLLQAAQNEIPTVISECEGVVKNQNAIIANATERAQHLQQEATSRASQYYNDAQNKAQQLVAAANQKAGETVTAAQQQAATLVQDAKDQANAIVADAQARADQLVSEQEILTRAQMEADELKRNTQEEVERLYADVYRHIDDVLAQLDRSISEKLTYDSDVSPYIGYSLRPMLLLARAILTSALERRETRGAHIRNDYPEQSNEFAFCSVCEYQNGEHHISYVKEDEL
jgi:aspartate oxidase